MASRQEPTASAPAAPRDKFASMAARQQQGSEAAPAPVAPVPVTVAAAPKRDKFASMAKTTAKPARDKFASLAQTTHQQSAQQPKRDKFASLAQQSNPPIGEIDEEKRKNQEKMKALKTKIQQRQTVLNDLEKAEGHTWNLIQLSSKTAKHLTKLGVDQDSVALSGICSSYRRTLQQIHSLLSPHAKFVKSYQNFDRSHQEASEGTNMYAARVDTRLAQERRNVLQELLRLEENEAPSDSVDLKKRKREE